VKIAFLINSLSDGGAEKVLIDIITSLRNTGENVELICIDNVLAYSIPHNVKVTYLLHGSCQINKVIKLFMSPYLAIKLNAYIKKEKIQIVQCHLFRASYVALLAKKIFRSSYRVQTVTHSIISRLKKEGLAGKVNLKLIKWLYPFSDKIISVSQVVQDDMQKLFSFKNDLAVIHNPFDITKIQKLSEEPVTDFEFSENKKYIVCVGRLLPIKRNKDLLYALAKLPSEVEVLFIGEGNEKRHLIQLSCELFVSNRVHFVGWVSNPYKYIKRSDLLVSTSVSESFGNTIVEAFICKTPVISTACGGPSEVINYSDNLLISVGDIDELLTNINKVLFVDGVSNELVEKGTARSYDFMLSRIACQYKHILECK